MNDDSYNKEPEMAVNKKFFDKYAVSVAIKAFSINPTKKVVVDSDGVESSTGGVRIVVTPEVTRWRKMTEKGLKDQPPVPTGRLTVKSYFVRLHGTKATTVENAFNETIAVGWTQSTLTRTVTSAWENALDLKDQPSKLELKARNDEDRHWDRQYNPKNKDYARA